MLKKLLLLILLTISLSSYSQRDTFSYQIAFYNVENLFDPAKDSVKNDEAFTPEGLNRWTYKRYYKKISNIGKVVLAMGQGDPPVILGVAEIENDKTLRDLCYNSPLKNYNYQFVHYESPERRGIDVALIYRSDMVEILHSEPISIVFPFETNSLNRDILYVIATVLHRDTLHLFINHWTSRYGGYAPTIPKRNHYATVVKTKVDSIWRNNENANIVIMGDFNDYPTDESIAKILDAQAVSENPEKGKLYNLMLSFSAFENIGSHKHEDFWGCLDQIIVSGNLLKKDNFIQIIDKKAVIFKESFMMEPDKRYGGEKPLRTYLGPRYIGGYADHLPVFVRIAGGK
ncbi:endonuclease [Bacteroidales bacterium OttesenSCG-928-E04]|nr:endonuclease [Bacteroidales bacterium OttesenSCG-928-E04]